MTLNKNMQKYSLLGADFFIPKSESLSSLESDVTGADLGAAEIEIQEDEIPTTYTFRPWVGILLDTKHTRFR